MKKKDLMNGDIVVLRSGQIAVVIELEKEAYLLFQHNGFEFLSDYYDDDMIYEGNIDAIMQVFRPNGGLGFEGVDEAVPIYERDKSWFRPTEEAMSKVRDDAQVEKCSRVAVKKDTIAIISQAFYGNRTGTEIRRESIDRFILGYQSDDLPITEPVDRTVIQLPGSNNLVLIYNKYQEEEWLEKKAYALQKDNYVIKPLALIPELNIEIYSRCIVCRMAPDGEFESLDKGDCDVWSRYLSV